MCGIIGGVVDGAILPTLITGLKRLEYRGYDSAGFAIIDKNNTIHRQRAVGNIQQLIDTIKDKNPKGSIGIAHTRWATHGVPSVLNAHPHIWQNRIAIVHNGIIENYVELRKQLLKKGYDFITENDTESLLLYICDHINQESDNDLFTAVQMVLPKIQGSYAFALCDTQCPDRIIVAKRNSPLVIGIGKNQNFVASDIQALRLVTEEFIILEDNDIAEIKRDAVTIYDSSGKQIERKCIYISSEQDSYDKGAFSHYMLKEIHEQPAVIQKTMLPFIQDNSITLNALGVQLCNVLQKINTIHIVACGTSYHAAIVAAKWIEALAQIPVLCDIASEYRYRDVLVHEHALLIGISQSGETADTIATMKKMIEEKKFTATLAISNNAESSLVRMTDHSVITQAGSEIGVASTKAFTTQLIILLAIALATAKMKKKLPKKIEQEIISSMLVLPGQIAQILNLEHAIKRMAGKMVGSLNALYLGRGSMLPIAMEGALKLKEISYIHAEAFAAGELKHGPLALVDNKTPVVAIAPNDALLSKICTNLEEVRARGGKLYVVSDHHSIVEKISDIDVLLLPFKLQRFTAPILCTVPLQLLAYHIANMRGINVDQPRNLAKSVTVE